MSDELDVIERWIARHSRDLGRLQETDDFERGFRAALDLLDDLVARRRQRGEVATRPAPPTADRATPVAQVRRGTGGAG